MKPLSKFIFLAILVTLTISAPLQRSHGVRHRLSPHRGMSRRFQATLGKRPLNLTFTPTDTGDPPLHAGYGTLAQPLSADFKVSAALSILGGADGALVESQRPSSDDDQVGIHSGDTYGGRHIIISAPDAVVWELQQKGVSQDDIPHYVRQNLHISDPDTGHQYQLVPDDSLEALTTIDSSTIVIALSLNGIPLKEG